MTAPILSTHDLGVCIGTRELCTRLNLTVSGGTIWAVLGRNGAGKTTLLNTVAGLRTPARGEVMLGEAGIRTLTPRQRAQRIGVLFQDYGDVFASTVLDTALLGRHPFLHAWSDAGPGDYARAREALRALDIAALEQRPLLTLSGGERRRAHFATVLTQDPQLFLLDEPANHLDVHHQIGVLDLLTRRVRDSERAAIVVMHDINLAARFCDHALLLFGNGETHSGLFSDVATPESLTRLYAHPMHEIGDGTRRMFTAG